MLSSSARSSAARTTFQLCNSTLLFNPSPWTSAAWSSSGVGEASATTAGSSSCMPSLVRPEGDVRIAESSITRCVGVLSSRRLHTSSSLSPPAVAVSRSSATRPATAAAISGTLLRSDHRSLDRRRGYGNGNERRSLATMSSRRSVCDTLPYLPKLSGKLCMSSSASARSGEAGNQGSTSQLGSSSVVQQPRAWSPYDAANVLSPLLAPTSVSAPAPVPVVSNHAPDATVFFLLLLTDPRLKKRRIKAKRQRKPTVKPARTAEQDAKYVADVAALAEEHVAALVQASQAIAQRHALSRVERGSGTAAVAAAVQSDSDDDDLAAASKAYHRLHKRLSRFRRRGASVEQQEEIISSITSLREAIRERRASAHDDADDASSSSARATSLEQIVDAQDGRQYALWNSTGDDESVAAARTLRHRANGALRRARRQGASSDVIASLEAACEASSELCRSRLADPRNAEEVRRKKRVPREEPTKLPPDDGSISAAIALHKRAQTNRQRIEAHAGEAELARVDAALLKVRELAYLRMVDPVNAQERETLSAGERKRYARRPRSLGGAKRNVLRETRSEVMEASAVERKLTSRALVEAEAALLHNRTMYRREATTASHEPAEPTSRLRVQDAKDTEQTNSAKVAASSDAAALSSNDGSIGLASSKPKLKWRTKSSNEPSTEATLWKRGVIQPDDGSILAAHKMYNRAVADRTALRKSGTASEAELARADAHVKESRNTAYERYTDAANAEERGELPVAFDTYARPYREGTNKGRTYRVKLNNDGSIAAAHKEHGTARRRIRNARKEGASEEEMGELQRKVETSYVHYKRRLEAPENWEEAEALRARDRGYWAARQQRKAADRAEA